MNEIRSAWRSGYFSDGCIWRKMTLLMNLAHPRLGVVYQEHSAGAVHCDRDRTIQVRAHCWQVLAVVPEVPRAGDGIDNANPRHFADAEIAVVAEVHVPGSVHGNTFGRADHCACSGTAIPAETAGPIAPDSGNNPGRVHSADAVIQRVTDVEVALGVHGYAIRGI